MPSSPIKRKRKRRRIQLLHAEELSEEQPPQSYERKLDTVENAEEEQDIHLQIDSKRKATMFYPLKVVKEDIVIESDE